MVLLLALLPLILSADPDEKLPCVGEPLVPVKVTASTSKVGFGPELLIDGRVDTSWQPDADAAHNLWQWVRFDFGREVEITCIDIDNGVRTSPDSFCQYGHVVSFHAHSDSGRDTLFDRDIYYSWARLPVHVRKNKAPIVTTTLTLRVDSIEAGHEHGSATGVAEVRFFGRPAESRAPETGPVTCGSRRLQKLRDAVLEHCASSATRPTAECDLWANAIEYCGQSDYKRVLKWLPIKEDTWNEGRLELAYKSKEPPFPQMKASFVRSPDGHWVVESLTCMRGKKACELAHHVGSDTFDAPDPSLSKQTSCRTPDGRRFGADGKLIAPKPP